MPVHPPAPTELAALVEAFARTVQAVVDLGSTCTPADFAKATDCPGWSVQDQISHVASVECWLEGAPVEQLDLSDVPHVRNRFGRIMEMGVAARRDREGADVVKELADVLRLRLAHLRDPALDPAAVIDSPLGPRSAVALVALRIKDVWCHEQDIRTALGRPGNLDSAAAATFLSGVVDALPALVATRAGVPVDHTVIIDCTGPVVARVGVRVVDGSDGQPAPEVLFSGTAKPHVEGPTTTITLSTEALTRRAAGRRSVEDLHYTVAGDEAIARSVLEQLPMTP